jgi:hypothetical protein
MKAHRQKHFARRSYGGQNVSTRLNHVTNDDEACSVLLRLSVLYSEFEGSLLIEQANFSDR